MPSSMMDPCQASCRTGHLQPAAADGLSSHRCSSTPQMEAQLALSSRAWFQEYSIGVLMLLTMHFSPQTEIQTTLDITCLSEGSHSLTHAWTWSVGRSRYSCGQRLMWISCTLQLTPRSCMCT